MTHRDRLFKIMESQSFVGIYGAMHRVNGVHRCGIRCFHPILNVNLARKLGSAMHAREALKAGYYVPALLCGYEF